MKRLFVLLGMVCTITTAFTQIKPLATPAVRSITRVEYFFDTDPGIGKGTIIVPSPSDTLQLNTTIPLTNLTGFHTLMMRVRDTVGIWSMTETRGVYIFTGTNNTTNITGAEYFFDTDPGAGKANSVSVGVSGPTVNLPVIIPVTLAAGFHFLTIRTRDENGNWGFSETRSFYLNPVPVDLPPIVAAEYFFDADPGVGKATSLSVATPGNIVAENFIIPVPASLPTGDHLLAIRVKNQNGSWSLFEKDTITVSEASASITCPGNILVNALADQCVAQVPDIDPVVTPAGSSYTYTLTGATTGTGNGSASGLTFNIGTTTVTYALANAPNVKCSFTITVNTKTSVSIYGPITSLCYGTEINFLAMPSNGGFTPIYQWKKNGVNVGSNSRTYSDSTLNDGDTVTVAMTSSLPCANPVTVTSAAIKFKVTPSVTPSVSIAATTTTICPGQTITFTAAPVNGGNNPRYIWRINNRGFESYSNIFQVDTLKNGDSVSVLMYSSALCYTYQLAESNFIRITVNSVVTPSVTIKASSSSICPGEQVTFTATVVNGGNNPVYEWTLNNNAVGTNSNVYQTTSLKNGDVIRLTMSSSLGCASPAIVYSNSISISVNATVTYYRDADGDGYGNPNITIQACSVPAGYVNNDSDCNDANANIHPGAIETCNGIDDDCDGQIDEGAHAVTWYRDADGDGYGNSAVSQTSCVQPYGYVLNNTDCNDNNANVHPGATEVCNGVDDDCDGQTDEGFQTSFYRDLDGDGYGSIASGSIQACTAPAGYVANNNDCNDGNASVHPGSPEICGNGIDDNCNGIVDENCSNGNLPILSVRVYPVKEGNVGETILNVTVTLDKPAPTNAVVHYTTADEDAKAGLDYVAASGWLTIPAGAMSGVLQLRIMGDIIKEGNERFAIRFSQPSGLAFNGDSVSRVMIIDDDHNIKISEWLTIPNIVRRNTIWSIPGIDNFENEILILDANGQLIKGFTNYHNHSSIGNVAIGLYFYRIIQKQSNGEVKTYTGRLFVTE